MEGDMVHESSLWNPDLTNLTCGVRSQKTGCPGWGEGEGLARKENKGISRSNGTILSFVLG